MAPKKKYIVSAQLFSLRDYLKTPKDMKRTFTRLRKIGYEAAQISGVGEIAPADLHEMMMEAGIRPVGAHVGLKAFEADIDTVIADCKAWDVEYVAIPWMSADAVTTAAGWKKTGRIFAGYGKVLAAEGITLQYHNHAFEFQKYGVKAGKGGTTGLELLYAAADPKYLQAELDLGWIMRANQCPTTWIKAMSGRLDQVHLKDWGIKDNQPVWRAIGEGSSKWAAIIRACKASGTTHFIVEQDSCPITNNPFKSMAVSLDNLRALKLG